MEVNCGADRQVRKLRQEMQVLENGLANDLREIKALLWELLQELKKLNTK